MPGSTVLRSRLSMPMSVPLMALGLLALLDLGDVQATRGSGEDAQRSWLAADLGTEPIGFELAPEGVYLSQEPNLCLLVVVAAALTVEAPFALLLGFTAGLTLDLAPPADHVAGRWALALVLVGYLAGRVRLLEGDGRG